MFVFCDVIIIKFIYLNYGVKNIMIFYFIIEIVKLWSVLLIKNVIRIEREIGRKEVSGCMILWDK